MQRGPYYCSLKLRRGNFKAISYLKFNRKVELSILNWVTQKLPLQINFVAGWRITLQSITYILRLGRKLIAVTCWNHTKLAPARNFVSVFKTGTKSTQGEILPRVDCVATYKSFIIDKGNLTPGWISSLRQISRVMVHLTLAFLDCLHCLDPPYSYQCANHLVVSS